MRILFTSAIGVFLFLSVATQTRAQFLPQPTSGGNPITGSPTIGKPAGTNSPAATTTPLPVPTSKAYPTYIGEATCDACGYCKGGQKPGRWEACQKCIYKGAGAGAKAEDGKTLIGVPTPDPDFLFTEFGCVSTTPKEFSKQISGLLFGVVGSIAFLYLLYGAGIIATSRSQPDRVNYGKRVVLGSIIGLVFALASVLIIQVLMGGLGL